jgi:hypothetical protein
MKTIIYFFCGLLLMAATALGLFVSGILFDSAGDVKIEPFVFQPSDYSDYRMAAPVPLEQLPDDFVLGQLVNKFIAEYFGVIPSREEITHRGAGQHGSLRAMATAEVFADWKKTVFPELEKMAEQKQLRIARVIPPLIPQDDYYQVNYITETYVKPNILGASPTVKKGSVYMMLRFKKELLEEDAAGRTRDIGKYLQHGGDPAAIFKFQVLEVAR